jgi:uncharacterized protein (TIGR02284 family)
MAMATSDVIAALDKLIAVCRDGEQGFQTAAEGLNDPATRALFKGYAQQRAELVRELQAEVRRLGGRPEDGGTVSGAMHRGWMNIKSAVTGKDDGAIVAEAERGEDVAKRSYEEALKSSLPAGVHSLVQRQYGQITEAHDRVRLIERQYAK